MMPEEEIDALRSVSPSIVRKRAVQIRGLDWRAVLMVVLVTAMLATLSVPRYRAYNASMFDLGHMSQAIWSSTQGSPLEFSYRGNTMSRLALHVELIYFLLTPLYRLAPSPITLLIVQAALFGAGAFPLYALAKRRIGDRHAARLVTLIYLLYPVAHLAVLFDFHGDTLATPLLLFAFEALDREDWRRYWPYVILSLSCKVTVAVPVCLSGTFLWLRGRREVGIRIFFLGLIWGSLTLLVVRRAFATPGAVLEQASAVGYIQFYSRVLANDVSRT